MSDTFEQIRLGLIAETPAEWPLFVLKDQAFDRAHGLDVEVVLGADHAASLNDVIAGDVELAEVVIASAVLARSNGAPVRFVAGSQLYFGGAVVVGNGISDVADLRGRKIFADYDNPPFLLLEDHLERHGVGRDEWTRVPPPPGGQRCPGIEQGIADAAALPTQLEPDAQRRGLQLLFDLGTVYPDYGYTAIAASDSVIASRRDAVQRFVAAYADAIGWLLSPANEEQAIAILSRDAKLDADTAAYVYRQLVRDKQAYARDAVLPARCIEGVQSVLAAAGRIGEALPVADYAASEAFPRR